MLTLRNVMFATIIVAATVLLQDARAQADTSATDGLTAARVSLWDDSDHDGVLGTAGDTLRSRVTTTNGAFALTAQGCGDCGVIIDRVAGLGSQVAPRVAMSLDGVAMATMGGLLWRDANVDGVYGNAGDALIGTSTVIGGPLVASSPICSTCGLVVVEWVGSGQDIDWIGSGQDIDTISGSILDWGGSSQDIDWGGTGDDIDWGGTGDDIDTALSLAR